MELKCNGCKSSQLFTNCAVCQTRKCAVEKGVERCTECTTCGLFNPDLYAYMVEKLPHMRLMLENLDRIKAIGGEAWLSEQAELWKCPDCGTPFSWYAESCAQCNRDLDSCHLHRSRHALSWLYFHSNRLPESGYYTA